MHRCRLRYIDIAKGLTIVLMVIGHSSIPKCVSDWIYSFHMPLFFFVSGLCSKFEKDSVTIFVKKKMQNLGRPFLIYSAIVVFLIYVFKIDIEISIFVGWGGYALWFIPVFFVSLMLARFVFSLHSFFLRSFIIVLLPILSYFFACYDLHLPYNMSVTPYATFLIILAYLNKHIILKRQLTKSINVFFLLLCSMVVSQYSRLDMCYNNIIPILPITFGAIVGSLFICYLSMKIDYNLKFLSKILEAIGKQTMIVVAFSQIIVLIINKFLSLNFIVKYIITFILLVLIVKLKNKIVSYYIMKK